MDLFSEVSCAVGNGVHEFVSLSGAYLLSFCTDPLEGLASASAKNANSQTAVEKALHSSLSVDVTDQFDLGVDNSTKRILVNRCSTGYVVFSKTALPPDLTYLAFRDAYVKLSGQSGHDLVPHRQPNDKSHLFPSLLC